MTDCRLSVLAGLLGLAGVFLSADAALGQDDAPPQAGPVAAEMAGYLLVPHGRVPEGDVSRYGGGFGMYVAAWPLLQNYPGRRFQTGLFGTWMFAQTDRERSMETYSDIEGGLGWWRDTRFATPTPKFIMGGVAKSFTEWANGPGAGKGRDWDRPRGKYAVVQLSSRVLWPPDGLNLAQGTSGELFGYGYLPLPLVEETEETGGQCWTLFLNAGNFKGPVAFFRPEFWTKPVRNAPAGERPELTGIFLDRRPANPNKAIQMETQYVPAFTATTAAGEEFARIAPTRFPRNAAGETPLVHRVTAFQGEPYRAAVRDWLAGGSRFDGRVADGWLTEQTFRPAGGSTWKISPPGTPRDERVRIGWRDFAKPVTLDEQTYGYRFESPLVGRTTAPAGGGENRGGGFVVLPEYFRKGEDANGKPVWRAVAAGEVPAETGLADVGFPAFERPATDPYVTPDEAASPWKTPGPAGELLAADLGDGSRVTYAWYRFADQPAIRTSGLSPEQREALQRKVERIHREWTPDRDYLPPPLRGELADLDAGVLVTPPKGLEIGYVPIVVRQEMIGGRCRSR